MNRRKKAPPRGPRAPTEHRFVARALLALALGAAGCNLLVEGASDQCKSDGECERFNNGSVCRDGVCVSDGGSGGTTGNGGGGSGGSGATCFAGKPTKDVEYLNACTDADCEPFDNCERLGLCAGDTLPALVDPPAP